MKKFLRIMSLGISLVVLLTVCSFAKEEEIDPNNAIREETSNLVENIRKNYYNDIDEINTQKEELEKQTSSLLRNSLNNESREILNTYTNTTLEDNNIYLDEESQYNLVLTSIENCNNNIENLRDDMYEEIDRSLKERGYVNGSSDPEAIKRDNIEVNNSLSLEACDAALLEIPSTGVYYHVATKDFYYWCDYDYVGKNSFGVYTGLNDMWAVYDLVSVQHKDDNGWTWRNQRASCYFNNGMRAGVTNGDTVIEHTELNTTSHISHRDSFWNGDIYNLKDDSLFIGQTGDEYHIKEISVSGYLLPKGTSKSTMLKSDFSHNYETWILENVGISSALLDEKSFSLSVTYTKEKRAWQRGTAAREAVIPSVQPGC